MFFMKGGISGSEPNLEQIRADLVAWTLSNAESSLVELPIAEGARPPDLEVLRSLYTFFAFFYAHWIDRLAFAEFSEGHDAFMDAFHDHFIPKLGEKHYTQMPRDLRRQLENGLSEQFNDFQVDAGPYQIALSPTDPLQNSLPYGFSKNIAAELGQPRDAFVIARISAILASRLSDNKVRNLVRSAAAAQVMGSEKPTSMDPPDATRSEQVAEEMYQKMQMWAQIDKDEESREWWRRNQGRVVVAVIAGVAVLSGMCNAN